MLAGLEALRHVSRACGGSLPQVAMEVMLGHVTYGGHVTNGLDLNTVKAMVNFVATEQVKTVSFGFVFVFRCCQFCLFSRTLIEVLLLFFFFVLIFFCILKGLLFVTVFFKY